jgi:hypothetical protein
MQQPDTTTAAPPGVEASVDKRDPLADYGAETLERCARILAGMAEIVRT